MHAHYTFTSLAELHSKQSDSGVWRRMLEVAEVDEAVMQTVLDILVWTPSNIGNFTLSSTYDLVRVHRGTTLSATNIWTPGIPSKIFVYMWRLMRNYLPFPDNLVQFNVHQPSICCFCLSNEATTDHCLIQCTHIGPVWNFF